MKTLLTLFFLCLIFQLHSQYCTPTYNPDPGVHIHNFNLGDIVNRNSFFPEGNPYALNTDQTTNLEIGRTYPITASGDVTGGIEGDWAVWIDLNDDEVFSEDERLIYEVNVRYLITSLTIPENPTLEGKKRMRISYVWTFGDLEPCGEYNNGETEDYIVTFVNDPIDEDYYCIPYDALDIDAFFINDFTFGELVNLNSGSNDYNYEEYPEDAFQANFAIGTSYNYSIVKDGEENIDGGFTAWLDYNENEIFEDSEMIFQDGPDIVSAEGEVLIPNDESLLGVKRLRVRAGRSPAFPLDPCGFNSSTETEDYLINIVLPTSLQNNELDQLFSLFPNPTNNHINLTSTESVNYQYKVLNAHGQVVMSGRVDKQKDIRIETAQLSVGLYIIQLQNGEKLGQKTFVKM